jgi:hypothetical protein
MEQVNKQIKNKVKMCECGLQYTHLEKHIATPNHITFINSKNSNNDDMLLKNINEKNHQWALDSLSGNEVFKKANNYYPRNKEDAEKYNSYGFDNSARLLHFYEREREIRRLLNSRITKCDICNIEMIYSAYKKHIQTKKHYNNELTKCSYCNIKMTSGEYNKKHCYTKEHKQKEEKYRNEQLELRRIYENSPAGILEKETEEKKRKEEEKIRKEKEIKHKEWLEALLAF